VVRCRPSSVGGFGGSGIDRCADDCSRSAFAFWFFGCLTSRAIGQLPEKDELAGYREAGLKGGDPTRGKAVFESDTAGCKKCHAFKGDARLAGPDLGSISDKYAREQLVRRCWNRVPRSIPITARSSPRTTDGKVHTGVLHKRTGEELQLLDAEGKPCACASPRSNGSSAPARP